MARLIVWAWLVLALAATARADFIVTPWRYPGPVDDVYEFYALNNGANGSGTRLTSADVTLIDAMQPPPLAEHLDFGTGFVFKFLDNSGGSPADLTGAALYDTNGRNPAVLFGGHQDRTFTNILGDEPIADPNLYQVTSTVPDNEFGINYFFFHVTQWEQVGNVPGGVDASATANAGRGALIAVGVVPHGELAVAEGTLTAPNGYQGMFAEPHPPFWTVFPEPSSIGLLSVGSILLRVRRRRD